VLFSKQHNFPVRLVLASIAEIANYLGKAATLTAADEALLTVLHGPVERAIKEECGSELEYAQFTEFLPVGQSARAIDQMADYFRDDTGPGYFSGERRRTRLFLKNTPVWRENLAVYEDPGAMGGQRDGSFAAGTLLELGSDYFIEDNGTYSCSGVLRRNAAWTGEPLSIKVVYYGGWTDAQLSGNGPAADLKLASILAMSAEFWKVKALRSTGGVGGITSESIGKYSYSSAGDGGSTSLSVVLPQQVIHMLHRYSNRYGRLIA